MWLCFLFPTPAASSEPCPPFPPPPPPWDSLDSHWSIALTWKNTHPAATALPHVLYFLLVFPRGWRAEEEQQLYLCKQNLGKYFNPMKSWNETGMLSPLTAPVTCAVIDCCESGPLWEYRRYQRQLMWDLHKIINLLCVVMVFSSPRAEQALWLFNKLWFAADQTLLSFLNLSYSKRALISQRHSASCNV